MIAQKKVKQEAECEKYLEQEKKKKRLTLG
jgi:hypothetical protein